MNLLVRDCRLVPVFFHLWNRCIKFSIILKHFNATFCGFEILYENELNKGLFQTIL